MPLKVFTFKIEPELLEEIDRWCERLGENRSEFIRKAIQFYINHLHEERRKRMERWKKIFLLSLKK